jgi:hypothetical protein
MQNLKKAAIPIKRSAPYKSKQEKLDEKIEEAYKDELRSGNVKSASFSQFSQSFKEKLNASRTPSPDSVADGTEVKSKDPHSR